MSESQQHKQNTRYDGAVKTRSVVRRRDSIIIEQVSEARWVAVYHDGHRGEICLGTPNGGTSEVRAAAERRWPIVKRQVRPLPAPMRLEVTP